MEFAPVEFLSDEVALVEFARVGVAREEFTLGRLLPVDVITFLLAEVCFVVLEDLALAELFEARERDLFDGPEGIYIVRLE